MKLVSKQSFVIVVVIGICLSAISVCAQSLDSTRLRILSYNMDSLVARNADSRYTALKEILTFVIPDIIVAQGVNDSSGVNLVRSVFHHGINGVQAPYFGRGHSVLMFDSTLVKLAYYNIIPTVNLPIDEYIMFVPATSDTFIIVSCEFEFGNDSIAIEHRQLQSQALRYHLHQRRIQNVLVVGTLNFYSNVEKGYRWLTEDSPFGDSLLRNPMRDPVDSQGVWHHNPNFARLHTYSSRLDTALDTSGVVDRFDYILLSQDLRSNAYVNSTHKVTGNFGKVFGKSITGNGTIGSSILPHLEKASRHLPVQIDLMFRRATTDVKRGRALPKKMDLSSVDWHSVYEALIAQPSGGSTPNKFPLTGQQSLAAP